MQKYFRRPDKNVSDIPYPSIGRALWGTKLDADDTNIITIDTSIIGRVIKVTLEIDLNPNKFVIPHIATNTSITISRSILGKYISTKLSAKVLITKPEIVRKYMHIPTPKTIFKNFPPVYSQISIRSYLGKKSNIFEAI